MLYLTAEERKNQERQALVEANELIAALQDQIETEQHCREILAKDLTAKRELCQKVEAELLGYRVLMPCGHQARYHVDDMPGLPFCALCALEDS